jgi:hypothetical protein
MMYPLVSSAKEFRLNPGSFDMLCYSGCNPRLLAWKNHMCSKSQGLVGVYDLAKKNTSLEYKKYSPITMLLLGGPVEKMCFFQMAPIPPLSVSICSTMCQYDILKVWLKKNDHFLTCGAAKVHIFCVLLAELVTDLIPLGTDPFLVLSRL